MMAKEGLDFFPLDCYMDEKLELIEAEFGLKGFALIIKLFQRIYGIKGYYCEWNKDIQLLFARQNGLSTGGGDGQLTGAGITSPAGCNNLIQASVSRGIFSEELYKKYGILTSRGIQKRYVEATSRRIKVVMKKEYLLLSEPDLPKNVYINEENVYKKRKNVCRNQQSKVKESKVKESIYTASYFENEDLNKAFIDYLEHRKSIGDEVKGKQIALLMEELDFLSNDAAEQTAIVKKATMSNWKSFYPLKPDKKKKSFEQRDYDMNAVDELEKKLLEQQRQKYKKEK